jgi:hypothetical protein
MVYAGLRAEYDTRRNCGLAVTNLKEEYKKTYWGRYNTQNPMLKYEYVLDQCETGVWSKREGRHDAESM